MANSATLLAALLVRWEVPPNTKPESHRGQGTGPSSLEFWRDHVRAVIWLTEVESALQAMEALGEDVSHFREAQPAWYGAVFAMSAPWGTSATHVRKMLERGDLGLLRALGQQLDSVGYTPPSNAISLEQLRTTFEEVETLVTSSTVPVHVKRYLLGLVTEARTCLVELDALGEVRLRRVTFELGGALNAVAETAAPEGEKTRWRAVATMVLTQFAIQTAAAIAGGIGTQALLGGS